MDFRRRLSVAQYIARLLARLLPVCLICAVVVVTYFGIRKIESITSVAPRPLASGNQQTTEQVKASLDDLKWMLGLIVTAAGLFSVAQAAAAWFNAQTFTKQSEDAIKRIEVLEKDVEARYPIFARTEQSRKDAYHTLAITFQEGGFDWRNGLYENTPLQERQRLLSVEQFVGLEFLAPEKNPEFASSFRALANFYASKFVYERKNEFGNLADIERAEYYLHIARDLTDDAFYILNDPGVLYLEFHKPRDMDKARFYFEQSRKKKEKHQRVHYNFGVIAAYEKEWRVAADSLELALKYPVWELTCKAEMKCTIFYNLACARARLFYRGGRDASALLEGCFEALEKAAEIGQIRPETRDADLDTPDGDLYELRTHGDAKTMERLEGLRGRLSYKGVEQPISRPRWDRRFSRAFESLRGKF